ncbi:uncharacterized protein LOC120650950 [Panicum virgatum]|uniref:AAA+ ATPase At3g28540-like C-terminal domain-containing protein n=1 Tax=Panicum virgatum TaxID=38727 RepID=A0A8T0X9S1_PANVG|nr:uncharacterized protein LOC120650950 [Panicum virgatum]KAG2655747.1 hypothetical protein PVAP13_1KG081642 [Panicum virgatum]
MATAACLHAPAWALDRQLGSGDAMAAGATAAGANPAARSPSCLRGAFPIPATIAAAHVPAPPLACPLPVLLCAAHSPLQPPPPLFLRTACLPSHVPAPPLAYQLPILLHTAACRPQAFTDRRLAPSPAAAQASATLGFLLPPPAPAARPLRRADLGLHPRQRDTAVSIELGGVGEGALDRARHLDVAFRFLARMHLDGEDADGHELFGVARALLEEVNMVPVDVGEHLTRKSVGDDAGSCLARLVAALQKAKEAGHAATRPRRALHLRAPRACASRRRRC